MDKIVYNEGLQLVGHFKIQVYDNVGSTSQFKQFLQEEGNRKRFGFSVDKDNLIVNTGLMLSSRALYKSNNNGIAAIAFGSGGAPVGDPLTPIPPVVSDTELATEEFRVPVSAANVTYSDVSPYSVTFTTIITNADYSGVSYLSEAGLVGNVNKPSDPVVELDLFSKISFPSIPFTGSVIKGILAEWTIFLKASSSTT